MTWICAAIYVLMFLFGKVLRGRWLNLLSIFSGFYALSIILANLRLTGINPASFDACLVMIAGEVSYVVGYVVICALFQKHTKASQLIREEREYISNNDPGIRSVRTRIVIVALLIVLAYSLYRLYILFTLLHAGYSYERIRTIYFNSQYMFEENLAARYGRNRLDIYLVQPLIVIVVFFASINFFSNETLGLSRKGSIQFLVLAYLSAGLTAVSNGGRELILYSLLIFVFTYAVIRQKRGIRVKRVFTRRQKRMVKLLALAAVITIVVMTFGRSKTGESSLVSLFRTLYVYYTGYLPHLSVRLQNFSREDYTYGYTFILGLIKLPGAIIHRVLGVPVSHAYSVADTLTSQLQFRVDIGGGHMFNAYTSLFYYFFSGFGYLSLVIGSFIFGGICATGELSYERRPTVYNLFMYLFCFYLIITSMVRWEMVHPKTAMALYFIPLLFNKYKKSDVIPSASKGT